MDKLQQHSIYDYPEQQLEMCNS